MEKGIMAKPKNTETETENETSELENNFEPVPAKDVYARVDEGTVKKINGGEKVRGIFTGFFESPAIEKDGTPIEGQKWLQIGLSHPDIEGVEMYRCTRGLKNALKDAEVMESDEIQISRKGSGLMDTKWTITRFA